MESAEAQDTQNTSGNRFSIYPKTAGKRNIITSQAGMGTTGTFE